MSGQTDADDIRVMLRAKFPPGEYAVLEEVRDATGFEAKRSCDALVMSLWPSRGLELWGVEIKVSRSDWTRERKEPEKAEHIAKWCDRWFVAVPDAAIVADELPPAWGLMVVRGGKLVTTKPAEKQAPAPLSRSFLAAMFRRAQETGATAQQIRAATQQAAKAYREQAERQQAGLQREHEELKRLVEKFEAASGVRIRGEYWDCENIGDAVRVVRARRHGNLRREMEGVLNAARRIVATVETEIAGLDATPSGERVA